MICKWKQPYCYLGYWILNWVGVMQIFNKNIIAILLKSKTPNHN